MSKIQLSQRMYSIVDIIRLLASEEMAIQPKYQRRRTGWPLTAKTALIDTIMNNFPVPPIYLRDYVNDSGRRRKEIIDGQQRISTINEFYHNDFPLSKNIFDETMYGCFYKDLPDDEQKLIEDFEVSFIAIRGASESDIISIFSRLNSFSLPLNTQEKRNSKYAGEIKTLIYEVASEYHTFWLKFNILSANQIARMADASLISDILYTILNGIRSASSKAIDNMYADYDNEFEQRSLLYKRINETMSILGTLMESVLINRAFRAKFMFYSLFVAVYSKLFGIPGRDQEHTGNINLDNCLRPLEQFSYNYINPDYDPAYKAKLKQATGNGGQRNFRHDELAKLLS